MKNKCYNYKMNLKISVWNSFRIYTNILSNQDKYQLIKVHQLSQRINKYSNLSLKVPILLNISIKPNKTI